MDILIILIKFLQISDYSLEREYSLLSITK
jgi:hypothetical protein